MHVCICVCICVRMHVCIYMDGCMLEWMYELTNEYICVYMCILYIGARSSFQNMLNISVTSSGQNVTCLF